MSQQAKKFNRMKKTPKKLGLQDMGFVRVAAVTPRLKVADTEYNADEIVRMSVEAAAQGAYFILFPELSITGYTCGDLFFQEVLHKDALIRLEHVAQATKKLHAVIAVGLPLVVEGKLFNVVAVITEGKVIGIVPKTYLPTYKEFYEGRWFKSSRTLITKSIELFGYPVPIGTDLLFRSKTVRNFILALEICEDLWMQIPPSSFAAIAGATVIANPSASNEVIGKGGYRVDLVGQQSARTNGVYVYTSCGVHESSTDVVFGGHRIIAENGSVLAASQRFERESSMTIQDVDLDHAILDRIRTGTSGDSAYELGHRTFRTIDFGTFSAAIKSLLRFVDAHPFVPQNSSERDARVHEIFSIQAAGLMQKIEQSGIRRIVLGLSGGLDSTLAILVAVYAFDMLKISRKEIYCYTMPGFGTTNRTKSNAWKLAEALGVRIEEINITAACRQHFHDISHNGTEEDVTYENAQARYRTMVLMDKANMIGAMVLGTGDLSEIALGWCTFIGDHASHYHVNCSMPKTLVKYIVAWVADQKEFTNARTVLLDVIDTPVSPELKKGKKGKITQKTEDIIGPYELHDFFLYHFMRWGSRPQKIAALAETSFAKEYTGSVVEKWLRVFVKRFFGNQWKRSMSPDGPKVGSIALSPRGDWRMPSDAEVSLWLKDIDAKSTK
jgi:NAD+ synthase (glutamine-hydrolysing)